MLEKSKKWFFENIAEEIDNSIENLVELLDKVREKIEEELMEELTENKNDGENVKKAKEVARESIIYASINTLLGEFVVKYGLERTMIAFREVIGNLIEKGFIFKYLGGLK